MRAEPGSARSHRARRRTGLGLLALLLTAGCAGLTPKSDLDLLPTVTVVAVAGPARLRHIEDTAVARPLAAGDTLVNGSWLTALTDSTAIELEFTPGGRSTLAGEAELTVAFGLDDLKSNPFITLFLNSGSLATRIAPSRGRRFEVTTPAATAGVRGTAFDIIAGLDGSTELYVDTGTVELTDNQTGETMEVGAGEAAEDLVDRSPARRRFLDWAERRRWAPRFLRERREQLRERIAAEFSELDGRMEGFAGRQRWLADSVAIVHRERAATLKNGYDSGSFGSLAAWLEHLQELAAREVQLYQQIVKLNLQMHRYSEHLRTIEHLVGLTREQQQTIARTVRRIELDIDNNRRLFLMGDPVRNFLLRIYDRLHPGDESKLFQPQE